MLEITKDNFENEVIGSMIPVIVDFWADWCGPCKMQTPILEELAEDYGDKIKICKVNVDQQPLIAMNYQIASIPTLVFMKEGMFKGRMVGLQSKDTIAEFLDTIID